MSHTLATPSSFEKRGGRVRPPPPSPPSSLSRRRCHLCVTSHKNKIFQVHMSHVTYERVGTTQRLKEAFYPISCSRVQTHTFVHSHTVTHIHLHAHTHNCSRTYTHTCTRIHMHAQIQNLGSCWGVSLQYIKANIRTLRRLVQHPQ